MTFASIWSNVFRNLILLSIIVWIVGIPGTFMITIIPWEKDLGDLSWWDLVSYWTIGGMPVIFYGSIGAAIFVGVLNMFNILELNF